MSIIGRLRCWLTGHDWQWTEGKGEARELDGELEWCPRCTRVRDVRGVDSEEST